MSLTLRPITVKAARKYVAEHHRHLPKLQGGLFAVSVVDDAGKVRGVGVAVNPARVWQGTGRIVIGRVATDGAKNACSMIYGSLCRAAKALGYVEAWTYTLPEEDGASVKASGFEFSGITKGGNYGRRGRPRGAAVRPEPKKRWLRKL